MRRPAHPPTWLTGRTIPTAIFERIEDEEIDDIRTMHRRIGEAMRANDLWEYTPGSDAANRGGA
ncbi:hypothetical protein BRC98_00570 [Halobacteriales archaeon QS_7_68_65]|nr:MAG: hypothetical protein BRC98_00570 [Halobacteriales archaeon QS_7_68_65]